MTDVAADLERLRALRGEKWRQYPEDVLPAWVADMDFEIADPIRAAILERVRNSDCGYPPGAAQSGLPEIVSARVGERFGWAVDPGQVDLFVDVVQGIYFGLLGLAAAGDGVVIQTPIYPPFMSAVKATERREVFSPLTFDASGFSIDFDRLRADIDAGTRILLLCNPHNPSGRCFTRGELESLATIALERGLWIISDEIHADLVYSPHRHIPIASLAPEVAARTVTLMSASKAFNIAGICMAFAIFGGDDVRRAYATVPRHLRGATSALSIAAVSAALTQGQPWLDETLSTLSANRDFVAGYAREHWPGCASRTAGSDVSRVARLLGCGVARRAVPFLSRPRARRAERRPPIRRAGTWLRATEFRHVAGLARANHVENDDALGTSR